MTPDSFKKKLRERGVKLSQLQDKIGISKGTYSRFINGGSMSPYTLKTMEHWMETGEKHRYHYMDTWHADRSRKYRAKIAKNKDSKQYAKKRERHRLYLLRKRYAQLWDIKAIEILIKKELSCQEKNPHRQKLLLKRLKQLNQ